MKQRVDVMLDLETLSLKKSTNVIQIAAVPFNLLTGNPDMLNVFNGFARPDKTRDFDAATLSWWIQTNPQLLQSILDKGKNNTQQYLLEEFVAYINILSRTYDEVYLWGNGVNFDNAIIENMCEQFGQKYPIHYKRNMDMRTLLDTYKLTAGLSEDDLKDSITFDGDQHNALHDCLYQIAVVHKAMKRITYGE